jgi:hypothetical protein
MTVQKTERPTDMTESWTYTEHTRHKEITI